uniref:Uncharacterized protein n=1 Tax=Knipowitschia caucasica TaxID=637954 RepID=A0AAV2LXG6_KNICA
MCEGSPKWHKALRVANVCAASITRHVRPPADLATGVVMWRMRMIAELIVKKRQQAMKKRRAMEPIPRSDTVGSE